MDNKKTKQKKLLDNLSQINLLFISDFKENKKENNDEKYLTSLIESTNEIDENNNKIKFNEINNY